MLISPGRIGRIGQPTGPMGRVSRLQSLLESLFGNGEQGAFFVPRPAVLGQQVLFQDAAGTTPVTADGDPVGRMLDLSGNDNHATQEVSGSRPIYRTDGQYHWLEFDGVDDYLTLGNVLNIGSSNVLLAASFAGKTGVGMAVAGKSYTNSDHGRYFLAARTGGGIIHPNTGGNIDYSWTADTDYVASLNISTSDEAATLRVGGQQSGSTGVGASFGLNNLDFMIGRYPSNYAHHNGPIYGVICAHHQQSFEPVAIKAVERYLASLAGVTL